MKRSKLNRRRQPRWVPLAPAVPTGLTEERIAEMIAAAQRVKPDIDLAAARERIFDSVSGRWWKNDRYTVIEKEWQPLNINGREMPVVWLSIRRNDREPVRDWRDCQRIKNEIVGPECEAIELYPAESRLTDTANQFHIWAIRDPTFRFPFGFFEGRLVSDTSEAGSVQRPRDDG